MGTFHHGKGDLHGITVVVDTHGPEVYVGRCDTVTEEGVWLVGADRHDASADGATPKQTWVGRAADWGFHPKIERVLVPTAAVASVTRLGEVSA
jgi:hypothetical protein